MRKRFLVLAALLLGLFAIPARAQVLADTPDSFSSRAELQRWEQRLQLRIRELEDLIQSHQEYIQSTLNNIPRLEQRGQDTTSERQGIARSQQDIKRSQAEIDKLRALLANPPPVIEQRAPTTDSGLQDQAAARNRQQEQMQESQELFKTWQAGRRKEQSAGFERQQKAVGAFGSVFQGLLQGLAGGQQEDDTQGSEVVEEAPVIQVPEVHERRFIAGSIDAKTGQFVPHTAPSAEEPAKRVFDDSLSSFMKEHPPELIKESAKEWFKHALKGEPYPLREGLGDATQLAANAAADTTMEAMVNAIPNEGDRTAAQIAKRWAWGARKPGELLKVYNEPMDRAGSMMDEITLPKSSGGASTPSPYLQTSHLPVSAPAPETDLSIDLLPADRRADVQQQAHTSHPSGDEEEALDDLLNGAKEPRAPQSQPGKTNPN
jgi:hypothetical protein